MSIQQQGVEVDDLLDFRDGSSPPIEEQVVHPQIELLKSL